MSTLTSGNPTVGLGRFIKESRFVIPSHQRDYSWTEEYVKEFVRDIEEAVATNRATYFCGLMVLLHKHLRYLRSWTDSNV